MPNIRKSSFAIGFQVALLLTVLPAPKAGAEAQTALQSSCAKIAADTGKSAQERFRELGNIYWKYQMEEYPECATAVGYPCQNGRWTDCSLATIGRRKKEMEAPLAALLSIDRSKLDRADQLNYDLLKYRLQLNVDGNKFPDELLPINQLQGVQQSGAVTLMDNPHTTVADYEDIISRLRGLPTVIEQSIALMKEGLKKGVTPPQLMLRDVPQQIKNQMVEDVQKSPLLEPFNEMPAAIPAAEQERLRRTAKELVQAQIIPAYGKLHEFFVKEYMPGCRTTLAATSLPDGTDWYAFKVRERTTTSLTPREIHEIGLAEVKRLRGEMDKVIAETGFKGTFKEFCTYLRTDPRFFYNDATDLLVGYRDIAKRIDPELIKQFGKLPRLTYGIKPVPAFAEKSQTTAYYQGGTLSPGRPGIFYANTYDLKSRPKWEMEALTLHEAVPGHHLQIALAQEMDGAPEYRKHGDFTAYVEGWGLYSESLGSELGMYKDPYSRFGQLTYEMWRSIRLVLDTGIHSMGWSRQQAIDFFRENCGKSDHDIEVEVDRYIVWPGQALAYKLGQLTILDLKNKAKQELGSRFDVRSFHDEVLGLGAVPLEVLKTEVTNWINQKKAVSTTSSGTAK